MVDENVENMSFTLSPCDTLFVLNRNNSVFKENEANIISKMLVVSEEKVIYLSNLSEILGGFGLKTLNIFSIFSEEIEKSVLITDKGCYTRYMNIDQNEFVDLINCPNQNFLNYNKHSLYIIRGGNYLDIKNLFSLINRQQVNLGRGGSQKSHIISPLDLRLSTYLLAMFNFDFNLINNLNTFNGISKDRYLSYKDNTIKFKSIKINS